MTKLNIRNQEGKFNKIKPIKQTCDNINGEQADDYKFWKIAGRFKHGKKPVTQDLQLEIHQIKQDIRELKTEIKLLNEQMAQEIIALKLEKQIFVPEEGTSYDLIMTEEKKRN